MVKICSEGHFVAAAETDMSNTAKTRRSAQRLKPWSISKLDTVVSFQKMRCTLHQQNTGTSCLKPGKYHRTVIQPHAQGQTLQRTMTSKFSSFSSKSHCLFPLYISTFTFTFAVLYSFPLFLIKNIYIFKIKRPFFLFHLFL